MKISEQKEKKFIGIFILILGLLLLTFAALGIIPIKPNFIDMIILILANISVIMGTYLLYELKNK